MPGVCAGKSSRLDHAMGQNRAAISFPFIFGIPVEVYVKKEIYLTKKKVLVSTAGTDVECGAWRQRQ